MKRCGILTRIVILMGVFLSVVGCATKYRVAPDNYPPNRELYDISMNLTYLKEEALIERFGNTNNPFFAPPSIIGANEMAVFELEVVNNTSSSEIRDSSILIPLSSMRVIYGGKALLPVNSFQLGIFWEDKLRGGASSSDRGTSKSDRYGTARKMQYIINRELLPRELTLETGSSNTGLIVFMGRFPSWGDGEVHIPVFTENKQIIGVFKDEFQFE